MDTDSLESRLARLELLEAARNLVADYADAIDRCDVDDLASLFAPGAALTAGTRRFDGVDEIVGFFRQAVAGRTGEQRHFVTNLRVVAMSESSATVSSYFIYTSGSGPGSVVGWGAYRDEVVRIDVGPRIVAKQSAWTCAARSRTAGRGCDRSWAGAREDPIVGTMTPSFVGEVAFVTGGGAGIGRATCVAFAAAGASVVVADVDSHGADATARLAREAARPGGGHVVSVVADVADESSVAAGVDTAIERLDHAVNAAAIEGSRAPCTSVQRTSSTGCRPSTCAVCFCR